MMICPSCSTPNSDKFRFCPECGHHLVTATALAANGPAPVSPVDGAGLPASEPAARPDEAAQAARLLEQGFDQYDQGEVDEALACCQAALLLDPSLSAAHSLLGMIYERMGRTAEAVQQYQMVLGMNPDSVADWSRLDALLTRRNDPGPGGSAKNPLLRTAQSVWSTRRSPVVIGAAATVVALAVGLWATSQTLGQRSGDGRKATRAVRGMEPGASMPRPAAPAAVMPGAGGSFTVPPGTTSGAAAPRPGASLPAPPPANAWPGLRGAYPPPAPVARAPQGGGRGPSPGAGLQPLGSDRTRTARRDPNGFLAPAPIEGVERIDPQALAPMADVPGAALPAFPGAPSAPEAARRTARGAAPVLPPVSAAAPRTAAPPAPVTAPPAPPVVSPPPSASIRIEPLEEGETAEQTRGMRQAAAPPAPAASLQTALHHQQMAAYYRRQGDHQAAYNSYQYARDLFRAVQQRGGREGAIAAQGAAAAQSGMSRLQGP